MLKQLQKDAQVGRNGLRNWRRGRHNFDLAQTEHESFVALAHMNSVHNERNESWPDLRLCPSPFHNIDLCIVAQIGEAGNVGLRQIPPARFTPSVLL